MRSRSVVPVVLALVLGLVAAVGPAASSAQSLAEARRERAALQQRLDDAATRLATFERRVAELEAERDELAAEATALEQELEALSAGIETRVIELFKRGSSRDPLSMLLAGGDAESALQRAQAMQFVVSADVAEAEALAVGRTQLAAVEERLASREDDLQDAVAAQAAVTRELGQELERAQQLEAQLEEEERKRREAEERRRAEEERRRQAAAERRAAERQASAPTAAAPAASSSSSSAPPPSRGGMVCPVDNPRSFTDTWGAPRSGGRSHRGTDILAPYGVPVRAITSGTWSIQSPGPSAGLWAILRGDDGNQYWYMHLQSHTVGNGARVSAGQQTGTNGDTGNARGTPHVHFELHPGGGSAINPYPMLKQVCG